MLHPLITVRHDQDWFGAGVILTVLLLVLVMSLVERWINGAADVLARGYDDRIQQPYPPRPAGGDPR